ncbi:glutaredoxin-C9-like [Senna tora]|uniref:Glutaredoxin-C9-like n=1 Tax=Senna tora TaxID=362788 RepID=A0A834SM03_9FABA|nr:glutaredoxin-C9-like [Senna tora]
MQQALPYRSWHHHHAHLNPISHNLNINTDPSTSSSVPSSVLARGSTEGMVRNMVSENAAIVFGRRGCCMSHVVKRLLLGLGVNPAVYEIEEEDEEGVVRELEAIGDGEKQGKLQLPAVFIGGKFFGGLDRLMATHISGELVPILKKAGALWL